MHPGDRRESTRCGVHQSFWWLLSTSYATRFLWFGGIVFRWVILPLTPHPTPSLSFCMAQIRVGLISVKLLIRPISRHAAKRLDLTGQAWVSTETTDLQPKLWIGNVPKHGAASWMESSLLHDDTRSMTRRKPLYFFTHLPRDAVIVFRGGFSVCLFYWFNFLATRCWWKFWLLT